MQHIVKKSLKISAYSVLALVAFCVSFVLGGSNRHNVSHGGGGSVTPVAHADIPYAQSTYGGSEGGVGSEGGSEGSGSGTGEGGTGCSGSEGGTGSCEGY